MVHQPGAQQQRRLVMLGAIPARIAGAALDYLLAKVEQALTPEEHQAARKNRPSAQKQADSARAVVGVLY